MDSRLERAWLLYRQGRYAEAGGEAGAALEEGPEAADVHALVALCRSKEGRRAEAMESARTALRLAPDSGWAHFVAGSVLFDHDDHREAGRYLREAVRLDPEEVSFRQMLAANLLAEGRRKEALEEVEIALSLAPEGSGLHSLRGLILYHLDRVGESEAAFQAALRLDPEDETAHAGLGRIQASRGAAEEAVERYREALRIDPNCGWAREGLLDALRARYPVYGMLLRWFEWTSRLSRRTRIALFLGLYLVFQAGRKWMVGTRGATHWILGAVLGSFAAFAILTWIADPLFNLLLRMRREGRLLLQPEEIRASNLVGTALGLALLWGVAALVAGSAPLAGGAGLCILALPSLAGMLAIRRRLLRPVVVVTIVALLIAGLAGSILATESPDEKAGFILMALSAAGLVLSVQAFFAVGHLRT